jgi:hypothetical protein
MFGHDYTDAEQKALDAVREHELFGSTSPAGIHNDYNMYSSEYPSTDTDYKSKYFKLLKKYKRLLLQRRRKICIK